MNLPFHLTAKLKKLEHRNKKIKEDEIKAKIVYLLKNKEFDEPITISKRTSKVVHGEANVEAAKLLGLKSVPIKIQ